MSTWCREMDKPENGLSFALTRLASSSPSTLMATSHIPAPLYVVNAESRLVKKAPPGHRCSLRLAQNQDGEAQKSCEYETYVTYSLLPTVTCAK